jgi:hypothetical protein
MILTVADPDAMFAKVLAAGARAVFAMEEAHGWRLGRVVDPVSHRGVRTWRSVDGGRIADLSRSTSHAR